MKTLRDSDITADCIHVTTTLPPTILAVLAATVLAAACTDLRSRDIPNWVTLPAIALALVLHPIHSGWAGLKLAAGGLGLAAVLFLPLFALRWLGGGDVKLMGAVGALAGASNLLTVAVFDAILGGIAAFALVLWKGRLGRTLKNAGRMLLSLARGQPPYKADPALEAGAPQSLGLPRAVTILLATALCLWANRA